MKKMLCMIAAMLVVAGSVFAQGGIHEDYIVNTIAGNDTFLIQGTGADTSLSYPTSEVMSFRILAKDTTSIGADSDSSEVVVAMQVRPDTNIVSTASQLSDWYTVRTWDIDRDSTVVDTTITSTAIPNARHCRFILTGDTGNKKLYASAFWIVLENYYSVRSR